MAKKLGLTLLVAMATAAQAAEPILDDLLTAPGVAFENRLVRWWGAPGSVRSRPVYRVSCFDTDAVEVHYAIIPGRPLADYTMPYWPIRSFLSFVDAPAEVAQQVTATYTDANGETHEIGFTPRSGVELAALDGALAVKVRNRSIGAPEDVTIPVDEPYQETNPLSLEQVMLLEKGSGSVPAHCTVTNTGSGTLRDVEVTFTFGQSFNWGRFGAVRNDGYAQALAPASGNANAFHACSEGMDRGFAVAAGNNATLTYELEEEMNRWRASLACTVPELAPGASTSFDYRVRFFRGTAPPLLAPVRRLDLGSLVFSRVQPAAFAVAPVQAAGRVSILDMLGDMRTPKVRGLNLRAGFPQGLEDLEKLRDWGCNLVITSLGDPGNTARLIARGHELGLEMLMAGRGSYREGSPRFGAYYEGGRSPEEIPDAHGQDEDHYYWDSIEPVRVFEDDFGKPMAQATHEERVVYWARCFADKWRGVQQAIEPHGADTDVWFYAPFPSVAHVDPVDSYDLFIETLAGELGESLTVFPFYYGIEYNQAEYMMRRWKDGGTARAAFLPMSDFMTKPSQFIRASTAARRGGADGTCGFHFAVGDAPPEDQWQWKAVMLAAWANFPTNDLEAYSVIEDPAELVEMLAEPGLKINAVLETDALAEENELSWLFGLLPNASPASHPDALTVRVTQQRVDAVKKAPLAELWDAGKGFLLAEGRAVTVAGKNAAAVEHACTLLRRFAETAQDE